MIRISDIAVPLAYDMNLLKDIVSKKLTIDCFRIGNISIAKSSIDSADKKDIHFTMTLVVSVSGDESELIKKHKKDKCVSKETDSFYIVPAYKKLTNRPVVVGSGPAGMFAALILAQAGTKPIILERGLDVDNRRQKVSEFWRTGDLNLQTNVQFGEGGAGTFSDGKLKTGLKDFRKMKVLRELVDAGAPPEIMYLSKPHIGTDRLNETVKGIRKKITDLGGQVRFGTTVTDILHKDAQVTGVHFVKNEVNDELSADKVVLAIGHSARDTLERLLVSGIYMEQKSIAVGVRIEHPQVLIDKLRYGDFAGNPVLGAADYKMVVHLQNGRAVYTFCMCPGGTVVAATSEKDGVVTNGMSEFARNGKNANCALLVTIEKKDLGSDHPLAGISYQRAIESAAFVAGGGGYKAPVQRLEDFLLNRPTTAFGEVLPSYLPGTEFAAMDSYLPQYITNSLRQAILEMGQWMPGYSYPDALLTGAETRSASPVRITRSESFEAVGIRGLYPCGEGAGYSGGIISAAVDGVICAERILGI